MLNTMGKPVALYSFELSNVSQRYKGERILRRGKVRNLGLILSFFTRYDVHNYHVWRKTRFSRGIPHTQGMTFFKLQNINYVDILFYCVG